MLGTVGGIGLLIGPAGLLWLNLKRNKLHGDPDPTSDGPSPSSGLFVLHVRLTGMLLLVLRATPSMPLLLCVHLGVVLALFAVCFPMASSRTLVYRSAALLKYAIERRQPNRLQLGAD